MESHEIAIPGIRIRNLEIGSPVGISIHRIWNCIKRFLLVNPRLIAGDFSFPAKLKRGQDVKNTMAETKEFLVDKIKYQTPDDQLKEDKYKKKVRDWMIVSQGQDVRIFGTKADFKITPGMTVVVKVFNGKYYQAHDKANPPKKGNGGWGGAKWDPREGKAIIMAACIREGQGAGGTWEAILEVYRLACKEVGL